MIKVDVDDLKKLSAGFQKYKDVLPKSVEQRALRRAVRPIFWAARQEVPVGRVVSENGWGRYKGPDYKRGGATRKDLRIKTRRTVYGKDTSGVWIGPVDKSGHVGWRNHFITRGVKGGGKGRRINTAPNDYLKRAHDQGIDEATATFGSEVNESFQKWAKKELPQP